MKNTIVAMVVLISATAHAETITCTCKGDTCECNETVSQNYVDARNAENDAIDSFTSERVEIKEPKQESILDWFK